MTNATIDGAIQVEYGIASEQSGQQYPAIQVSEYQPKNLKGEVRLVLSEASVDLMNPDFIPRVAIASESCDYGSGDALMFAIEPTARFVILAMPKTFAMDKETKEVFSLQKGQKLKDLNRVTASKLFLSMVIADEIVLNNDGTPQVFTLKLTSTKTALIGGDRDEKGSATIHSLNKSLESHFGAKRQWLTHLVSVSLKVKPEKFTSAINGKSSNGVLFFLEGGARALPSENQKLTFDLVSSDEFKELAKDPFRLNSKTQTLEESFEAVTESSDPNGIPF